MHLRPNELMFGVAPAILLDCARQLHQYDHRPFTLNDFCEALGAPQREAQPVLMQMISEGFIAAPTSDVGAYSTMPKLGQLALANISEGLPRAQADALLAQVLAKAELINKHPEKHECAIIRVAVFGSYLTQKEILGDLDIGVELKELPRLRSHDKGARYRALIRGVASPSTKVRALLRLRKPKQISIHDFEEVFRLGTPYRLVFGEAPDTATPHQK